MTEPAPDTKTQRLLDEIDLLRDELKDIYNVTHGNPDNLPPGMACDTIRAIFKGADRKLTIHEQMRKERG